MRIVVSGGAGFIGSHLVDRLIEQGHKVLILDNFVTGCRENVAKHLESGAATLVEHDITKPIYFGDKVDRIYHLASPASPIDYQKLPIPTMKVGALGTHNMLGMAKLHGARLLLASTSEVYGDPEIHPQKEDYWGHVNPVGPRSCYDEAKRFAEALTVTYRDYHKVDVRIIRIFNTYGPRMRLNDGRVVPAFISQVLRNEPLTLFGDGSQTRSFCYVSDLVDGMMAVMERGDQFPTNLGNPTELTIKEFAERILAISGSALPIVSKPLPVDDPRRRRPDITRAKTMLGWEPKVALDEGLRRTIEWARRGKLP
ncbi:MAG TPA: SDR family oxidoreductase [Candidatus Ozemobacteraceae bacterium]|mgnify:CR=1 FL=1|nr:SDR family oxidoreductase [Candidatus Ozemobacteraceae bacterium]